MISGQRRNKDFHQVSCYNTKFLNKIYLRKVSTEDVGKVWNKKPRSGLPTCNYTQKMNFLFTPIICGWEHISHLGPSTTWTALNFILDVFFYNVLYVVLIAVFVSDDPFIFSSWDESGQDSTSRHRSEQTSIFTSPRAPIGNDSEMNHSVGCDVCNTMQVPIDHFFLVQTVHHYYHMLLAHCHSIVWPGRLV